MSRDRLPPLPPEDVTTVSANYPVEAHDRHDFAPPAQGRWCPYCGANLNGIPLREDERHEDILFASTGRRLKVFLAVGFVLVWLSLSVFDWLSEPTALTIPGWFSALGALMLFYLLGFSPLGLLRKGR